MNTNNPLSQPASLRRRFAAILYDAFLIVALLMLVATPAVLLNGGVLHDGTPAGEIKNGLFLIYLLCWTVAFYTWFWTHGGQTLGMNAWKIRITGNNGRAITWKQAVIRCLSACLGLANLSCLISQDKRGWHEQLSGTRTISTLQ